ncbi:Poly(ADP-ribose) glycohydrolase 1 [Glycine max]|nr:Poly(ADP-ribose) glycohydrolase 1 [Glycine max]
MEEREELQSILAYLPVVMRCSSPFWPSQAVETLRELGGGRVNSGHHFFQAISDLRNALSLSSEPLAPSAPHGYALFFDEVMSGEESSKWFQEVLPALGNLLLRLPSLLESHYQNTDNMAIDGEAGAMLTTALRLLDSQQPGIVFLTQELIAALLSCSLFCLFPVSDRPVIHLPMINFDVLFGSLYDDYSQKQENKIWCIVHYFQRISSEMPKGIVSFERKVLPFKNDSIHISYPDANFWSTSAIPLCRFEVHSSGLIEDQSSGAVEVDFANKYLGGGALGRGCVQEEIRFMVSPELMVGMLFLPAMADNEAIEIVGVERFSSYTGYASSFRFSGDYVDEREVDTLGRRKTRIVAIDALCSPGMRQYRANFLLRNPNHSWEGFKIAISQRFQASNLGNPFQALLALEQEETVEEFIGQFEKHVGMVKGLEESFLVEVFLKGLKEEISSEVRLHEPKNLMESMVKACRVEDKNQVLGKLPVSNSKGEINKAFCGFLYQCKYQPYQKILQENGCTSALFYAATSTSMETDEGEISNHKITNSQNDYHGMDQGNNIGVATGNWGCGAFGGDPEVKTIIQWLAASQALRPFIAYYTFGLEALQSLDEVAHWILSQRWTVGDLWNMLIEYSINRSKGETNVGFLQWLLPSIYGHGARMDLPNLA